MKACPHSIRGGAVRMRLGGILRPSDVVNICYVPSESYAIRIEDPIHNIHLVEISSVCVDIGYHSAVILTCLTNRG
jgi:hypothetical protein